MAVPPMLFQVLRCVLMTIIVFPLDLPSVGFHHHDITFSQVVVLSNMVTMMGETQEYD